MNEDPYKKLAQMIGSDTEPPLNAGGGTLTGICSEDTVTGEKIKIDADGFSLVDSDLIFGAGVRDTIRTGTRVLMIRDVSGQLYYVVTTLEGDSHG